MPALFDKELLQLHWHKQRAWNAVPAAVMIGALLAAGIVGGDPRAGMVAASGAFTVGMGSLFQRLGKSRVAPMLWSTLGMGVAALCGSLVGHAGSPGTVVNAAGAGFFAAMLLALGPGAAWIGQQCAIIALVASGYPVGTGEALARAGFIVAGGLLQTAWTLGVWRLRFPAGDPSAEDDPFEGFSSAVRTLRAQFTPGAETLRFALRQSATLAVGAELARATGLFNGYWVPMTALLVLKADFRQTFRRGLERVAGTLLGAGLATLLVHGLRLEPAMIGALIVLFAWLGYTTFNVNYAVYAVFLTAYIIFLLDFGGLDAHAVVLHRTLNTVFGGLLALGSYATVLFRAPWQGRRSAPTPDSL